MQKGAVRAMSLPLVDSTQDRRSAVGTPLMAQLGALVKAHRAAFHQERTRCRAWLLLCGWLFTFSRKTMTQLLSALGLLHSDWSAWYQFLNRCRVDYARLTQCLLVQTLRHVPAEELYRVVLDGTSFLRHSRTMPGTFWGRAAGGLGCRTNLRRMQRFLNLSWLLPAEHGYTRALPLRFFSALPPKAVAVHDEPARTE